MKRMHPSSSSGVIVPFQKQAGWAGGVPSQRPPKVAKELLARTYEVGVTILATFGGMLGIPRTAGLGLGDCRVPAPSSILFPSPF